jgi:hypothetical protein
LESHGDRDFEEAARNGENNDDENESLFQALGQLRSDSDFEDNEDADSVVSSEDEELLDVDTQFPAIAATIPNRITAQSFNRFRRGGPFGKLHNIGVLLRKSSTLKHQVFDAQCQINPDQQSRAWIHNVAIRWSSDYAMAE